MRLGKKHFLKTYLVILFLVVALFPKITLIAVSGSHAGIRLEDLMIAGYLVIFLVNISKNGFRRYENLKKISKVLFFCLVVFAISNIVGCISGNITPYLAVFYLIRVFEYFVLIFAGSDLASMSGGKALLLNLIKATIVFHGVYSILEYFSLTPDITSLINRPASGRVFTTFSGPYELAGYLAICLPLILNEIFTKKKYINIIFVILIFIGVILSESRVALVAIAIMTIVWVLRALFDFSNRRKTSLLRIISLALVLVAVVVGVARGVQSARFSNIDFEDYKNTVMSAWENADYEYYKWNKQPYYNPLVFSQTSDRSFALRITKWTVLIKEAIKTPLFGLGMSISGEAMDGGIVKLFCETGIIGLSLWITLMVFVWKQAKNNKETKFIISSIIIILFMNALFIDIFDASKVMMTFWFIVGYYLWSDKGEQRKTQKKILILSDNNLHTIGGSQQSIVTLLAEMNNIGYEMYLFMPQGKDNSAITGVKQMYLYKEHRNKFLNFVFMYLAMIKYIRIIEPNVVHAQNTKVIFTMGVMSLIQPIKDVRYIITDRMFLKEYKERTRKLLQKVSRGFDLVITTTEINRLEWAKVVGAEKVVTVQNVLDEDWFEYSRRKEKAIRKKYDTNRTFNIGFSGRYEEYKRWDTVLEICKDLSTSKNIQFVVAITADAGYRDLLREYIRKLKKITNKRLILFVDASKDEMKDFYYMIDAFVLTSRNESFGRVLIEAMTKRTIVFGTNSGGVPDILDKKFLFNVGDAKEAVLKIMDYMGDANKSNDAKDYFLKEADNYRADKLRTKMNFIYERLTNERKA